ncbi:hypothetical protein GOBAR_DD22807 [Gossypium barbadense]|nr:hypothetical protein GOBAR_DD22807 [Gossypium barbadense]
MANIGEEDDIMDLPPGFRFHPTDEELIHQYLYKKVLGINFSSIAIGEVDLNKSEPWNLPWKAKMGEKEWYFFCVRDRKYPTGLRTNRATDSGYWKATGKDKEIYMGKSLVGMKKTLVFYQGRAPKGAKTNWVMHEYRLDGKFSIQNLPKTAKNEWVICRVFQKSSDGKKIPISSLVKASCLSNELGPATGLPPLMDSSPYNGRKSEPVFADSTYVPCFSNPIGSQTNQQITIDHNFNYRTLHVSSNPCHVLPQNPFYAAEFESLGSVQEQSMLRTLIENHGSKVQAEREIVRKPEMLSVVSTLESGKKPFDDQHAPSSSSAGPVDLDCFWHY